MSLAVNIIFGDKKSICRNDAYAIVDNSNNEGPELLDIIPAYEVGNGRASDVLSAFQKAKETSSSIQHGVPKI